jgi:DNA/RNA-binding domain of Phe-tRNA-synthetase-like protein
MLLDVAPDLLELGLSACAVVARGVDVRRVLPALVAYRREAGQRLAGHWKNRSISTHPAIREYHRLHELFGVSGEPPAPEKLITYIRRHRDFTASGPVVDCYNIVSARTLLSIGAHDLERLATPVTLRRCTEADSFTPLGQSKPQPLAGEYGYLDSRSCVICRMEVLQGEHTKVTPETRDVVFFLQNNACLPTGLLLKGAWWLAEAVERFCGGTAHLAAFIEAPAKLMSHLSKPLVSVEVFRQPELRVGTVREIAQSVDLPALSVVRVGLDSEVEAMALTSAVSDDLVGRQVVVAAGLHPLTTGGRTFTAYLPAAQTANGMAALRVESNIPDGSRLD